MSELLLIGKLVQHAAHGRGIVIDAFPAKSGGIEFGSGTMVHVRWDEAIVWEESEAHAPEVYQSCWTDKEDLEILGYRSDVA